MLRIERDGATDEATRLRLEGSVVGPWVDELRRSCHEALCSGRRVVLDLGGVFFIAREGVDLIRRLPADRVTLERCSPFLTEQLQASQP
jgi:hypothetical protein